MVSEATVLALKKLAASLTSKDFVHSCNFDIGGTMVH